MKKTLLLLMALTLWTYPVSADEIDDALPLNSSLRIRNNTRQMVQTGISKDDATQLTRSMLQHRFQEEQTIQAQNMLMETMQSGLPVEPVMDKAREGMAKNKTDETIVQAMKQTQSRYAYAYRQAREITPDEESQDTIGQSIAQSMGAGLQDKDVEGIKATLQTRTRQMLQNEADELSLQTFQTARIMARLGVHSGTVSDVVSQALKNQLSAGEMQALGLNFNHRSRQMSSNQLANQFAQALSRGEKPGDAGAGTSNENNAGPSGSGQGSGNGNGGDGSGSGNDSEGANGSQDGSGSSSSGSGSSDSGGSSGGSGGSNDGGNSGNSGGSDGSGNSGGSGGSNGK